MIIIISFITFVLGYLLASLLANSKQADEINRLMFENEALKKANEELFEEGKKTAFKTLKEQIEDYTETFQKIPKKKFISAGK